MVQIIERKLDMAKLPPMDEGIRQTIADFVDVLDYNYGVDRDIYNDDGGYVVYVEKGTSVEEVKKAFDYSAHTIEYAEYNPPVSVAMYLLNNEFSVILVMHSEDTPIEILKESD